MVQSKIMPRGTVPQQQKPKAINATAVVTKKPAFGAQAYNAIRERLRKADKLLN